MIKENHSEFNKSNLLKWRDEGYQGQGVTIVILDDGGLPHNFTNVEMPISNMKNTIGHGTNVCSVVREVVPLVRMIALNGFKNKQLAVDWIIKHKDEIDIINCSFSTTKGLGEPLLKLKDLNIPLICASGNESRDNSLIIPARWDWTISIGAYEDDREKVADYSNAGELLDAVAYSDIYIPTSDGYDRIMKFDGTSCAAPMASGMLAIYLSWRKEHNLPKLTTEEVRKFIQQNTLDLYEEGHDFKSGYGLFRLPNEIPVIGEEDVMTNDYFKDDDGKWHEEFNNVLAKLGILEGDGKGNFRPGDTVTRGELSKVAVLLRNNILNEVSKMIGGK